MSATDHIVLKSLIIGLLRSHAVQTINFTAASVRIDHQLYSDLVNLVLADRLHLGIDPTLRSRGYRGMYHPDPGRNLLDLPEASLGTTLDASYAVHELTHAAVDMMNLPHSRGLHRTETEGIAYIAQRVYSRNIRADPIQRHTPHIFHVADAIAARIIKARPGVYHVSEDEIRRMRNAVGQHPKYYPYRGQRAPSDGI